MGFLYRSEKTPKTRVTKTAAQAVADPGPETSPTGTDQDGFVLLDALDTGATADREHLRDVIASVRFPGDKNYAIEWFHVFKALAAFDLWTDWDDETKEANLGKWVRYTHYTAVGWSLDDLRRRIDYRRVKKRLSDALAAFNQKSSPSEMVEDFAPEAFNVLRRTAIRGEGKDAAIAARDFTDRALPKVRRSEVKRDIQVHFPDGFLDALSAGTQRVQSLLEREEQSLLPAEAEIVEESPDVEDPGS